ncbi:hemerythrin domain-containing protein [Streptomyces boninensis]|uniref:hemerythrin domain-containing protein n=1 Tax=Streptomyces boninensis TaxID=2039455 RepID=UPI003B20F6B5
MPTESGPTHRLAAMADILEQAHASLRADLTALRAGEARPATAPGAELARHCLSFCTALGEHHAKEDGAFAELDTRFPHLTQVLTRLRTEHRTIAANLSRLRTLADHPAAPQPSPAHLQQELATLEADLEAHFAYEEQELLPALRAA